MTAEPEFPPLMAIQLCPVPENYMKSAGPGQRERKKGFSMPFQLSVVQLRGGMIFSLLL